jgi:hypothetical protein
MSSVCLVFFGNKQLHRIAGTYKQYFLKHHKPCLRIIKKVRLPLKVLSSEMDPVEIRLIR